MTSPAIKFSQISIHPYIKRIKRYYAKMGWLKETIFLDNLIVEIEGTEKARQMSSLFGKVDTCRIRDFFEDFKHISTNKKGEFDCMDWENAWQAFDSATLSANNNHNTNRS